MQLLFIAHKKISMDFHHVEPGLSMIRHTRGHADETDPLTFCSPFISDSSLVLVFELCENILGSFGISTKEPT